MPNVNALILSNYITSCLLLLAIAETVRRFVSSPRIPKILTAAVCTVVFASTIMYTYTVVLEH